MSSNQNKFKLILEFIELVKQKPEWEIEHLCDLLKINQDDFEYIINTVSDLYISNDFDLLLDIEIDNEKIKILINEVATTTHLITDMDLLSIYKILLDANIDFLESYIPSDYLTTFKETIDKYIPTQIDTIDTIKLNDFNLFEGENITIEYSPLGTISSYKYRIKPLSIVNNVEGVALLALDITANKTKTFLINRIVNISNEMLDSLKTKKTTASEKYIFEFSFRDGYAHLPELVDGIRFNKKNIYSVAFRNEDIALEFYKLNIYKIKAIDNNTFDDKINSSFNKVIKLINK
tara:strand:+ start:1576 stop:2451 length:876 start_codon:yes stop_codon:yes gene_type:complete